MVAVSLKKNFFFQAEDGIRDWSVTGVQTCALPIWQKNLFTTLKAGNIFGSEGLAINMSVYIDNLETEFLPLNCNWITSNLLPKFDEENNTFVEPYLPNYKIGIMHLAAGIWKDGVDMRINKDIKIDIQTLSNKRILKSLRYNN